MCRVPLRSSKRCCPSGREKDDKDDGAKGLEKDPTLARILRGDGCEGRAYDRIPRRRRTWKLLLDHCSRAGQC